MEQSGPNQTSGFINKVKEYYYTQIQFFRELTSYLGYEKKKYLINNDTVIDILKSDDSIINSLPFELYSYDREFTNITGKQLWELYQKAHSDYNKELHRKKLEFDKTKSGYVSKLKSRMTNTIPEYSYIKNSFPVKANKAFQLHHVSIPNSFVIDIMFDKPYMYLVMINANSRYLRATLFTTEVKDDKDVYEYNRKGDTYLAALTRLLPDIKKRPIYLKGDSEKAFNSELAHNFYNANNIKFTTVNAQDNHRSLALVDRAIRTIRDMCFRIRPGGINPELLAHVINQYNNAPHDTLSKYLGFNCTPTHVEKDESLERELIDKIRKLNDVISDRDGFHLPKGTQVKIEDMKHPLKKRRLFIKTDTYTVVDQINQNVIVKNNKGEIFKFKRSQIAEI